MILGAVMILMVHALTVNMMCIATDTKRTKVETSYRRSI